MLYCGWQGLRGSWLVRGRVRCSTNLTKQSSRHKMPHVGNETRNKSGAVLQRLQIIERGPRGPQRIATRDEKKSEASNTAIARLGTCGIT